MTKDEIRKALLEDPGAVKEVRTNDGRVFVVEEIEQWAIGSGKLVILDGPDRVLNILAIHNITSIGLRSTAA